MLQRPVFAFAGLLASVPVFLFAAGSVRSAEMSWHVTGQVGGPTSAVALQTNHAFVGVGFRVVIYDVSSPGAPTEVGSTAALSDLVTAISVSGARAFVTAGSAGLRIFDISDVTHPTEIGAWNSPGYAEAVSVVGSLAFVADGPFGLQIVDVSDPQSPRLVSGCFDMNYAYDVVVQDGHAYIAAAGAGLLIADLSDPLHPIEVGALDTPGFARRVAVAGNVAYVADQWGGVRVVSIADPAHPAEIASIALPSWAFGVALSGTTLFVADGSQGLRALDVTNPASSREVGAYPIPWQHTDAVALADGHAYIAVRGEGLHVVDIRDAGSLKAVSLTSQLAEARAVVAVGDIAYVAAADQGLRVVDLTAGYREIAKVPMPDGFAYCIATLGEGHLVVGSTGIKSSGLYFFDISDRRAPRQVGFLTNSTLSPRNLAVQGSFIAAGNETGTHFIDAANPASPVVLSYLDLSQVYPSTPGDGGVALVGSIACIAQGTAGLVLVDVADPRNPKIVGTYKPETLGTAQAVVAEGRYAYVLAAGLHVVDISDPRSPRGVAVLSPLGGNQNARLQGTTLLIAGGTAGLIAVDVADPATPRLIGSQHLPGFAFKVAPAGERLLVASFEAGLLAVASGPASGTQTSWSKAITEYALPASTPAGMSPALSDSALREILAAQVDIAARAAAECVGRPGAASRIQADAQARTLTVTSAADSGAGTLREILSGVKAGDVVTFDPAVFPPGAPATIRLSTRLPCLCSDRITIDASEAGAILDGSAAPFGTMGLVLGASNAVIKGLQITGFTQGVFVQGPYNIIGGDRSRGVGPTGEGNVISGNASVGVDFANAVASQNRVVGNFIGTDASGTHPLGRQTIGVMVFPGGPRNVIGGDKPGEGNVISGNTLSEVFLQQGQQTTIVGNLIGTDPTGTRRVGTASMGLGTGGHSSDNVITGNVIVASQQGIIISDSGSFYNQVVANRIGLGLDGAPPSPVTTGRSTGVAVSQSYNRIADNVIGGNTEWGITFGYWGSHDSVVTGNLIGTDPSGELVRPNGSPGWGGGVSLFTLTHGFVGGTTPDERNVIAGNAGSGILLFGPGPDGNFVLGNFLGTDITGHQPLANGASGVDLRSSHGSFVQGNVIAWNGSFGVSTTDSAGNRIRRNSIFANSGGGIVVDGATRTPTPPVIKDAWPTGVDGTACAGCVIELFSDAEGQGRTYEGSAVAAADGTFVFQKASGLTGWLNRANMTATATDDVSGTSAFSLPIRIKALHLPVQSSPANPPVSRRPRG